MGCYANHEIPLLVMLFYLFRDVEASHPTSGKPKRFIFRLKSGVFDDNTLFRNVHRNDTDLCSMECAPNTILFLSTLRQLMTRCEK